MPDDLQTQDSYARLIYNQWQDILYLSERVRTNYFFYLDKLGDLDDFQPSNEEKNELYDYVSKLVGLYATLFSKIIAREDFKKFHEEYTEFEQYLDEPWKLLQLTNEKGGFKTINKMQKVIGKALEKLDLIAFEKGD